MQGDPSQHLGSWNVQVHILCLMWSAFLPMTLQNTNSLRCTCLRTQAQKHHDFSTSAMPLNHGTLSCFQMNLWPSNAFFWYVLYYWYVTSWRRFIAEVVNLQYHLDLDKVKIQKSLREEVEKVVEINWKKTNSAGEPSGPPCRTPVVIQCLASVKI